MNIIMLGMPGAGKGTQAELLAKHYQIPHISSGDELRQVAKQDSEKGRLIAEIQKSGNLVPPELALEIIEHRLKSCPNGFILDGLPRSIGQAEALNKYFANNNVNIDYVIYYHLPDDIATERLMKRSRHEHRSDDTPETMVKRLVVFHRETEPIVDTYRKQGNLVEIDARPSINEIFQETLQKLS